MNYYITQYGPEDFAGKEMPEYLFGCDITKINDTEYRYTMFGDLQDIMTKIMDEDRVDSVTLLRTRAAMWLEW